MQFELLAVAVHIRLLLHDLLASCLGQRRVLRGAVGVVAGTGTDIADQHGAAAPNAAMLGPGPQRLTIGQGRAVRLSDTLAVPASMLRTTIRHASRLA